MASVGSLFSQTLQDITNTKLDEIAKKRKNFEDARLAIVRQTHGRTVTVQMLEVIAAGVKSSFSVSIANGRVVRGSTTNPRLEIDLKNLDRFLAQARYDPSVSLKVLGQWKQSLMRHLEVQSLKFTYASLYGHLTTEWLQSKKVATASLESENVGTESFEHLASGKKMESRLKWERSVFETDEVNPIDVDKLLEQTFKDSSEESRQLILALKALREKVQGFEQTLASPGNFNEDTLSWTIRGLVASDLLTEEKRAVLKDFSSNSIILDEIADVLNMRMDALDSWSWGDDVPVEERRQINGSFNIYMHEDLLQAIFLQYLGVKWSVFWKKAFSEFRKSKGVWKSPQTSIPLLDLKRREYFLGSEPDRSGYQSKKQKIYRKSYFLSQLLDFESQEIAAEEGDEEANFEEMAMQQSQKSGRTKQTARIAVQQVSRQQLARGGATRRPKVFFDREDGSEDVSEFDDDNDNGDEPKNPMRAKQSLLHLLSTEILFKTRFDGEITCFRSQFDNFYPSLPHTTIKSVLSFFGVTNKWLKFFERFLRAPLRFLDDETSEPRLRRRGTPGSHVLSEVFGEAVLFCLDYKINQTSAGEPLWRLHDDFWFWSSSHNKCVQAWTTITSFAKVMGLTLNEARTGSARILRRTADGKEVIIPPDINKALPQGQIRWGMLCLNPSSGRFEIDQEMVNKHIKELSRQLQDKSQSVFAWIQAWNTYATTFFTSNFGVAANCFGRQHVDDMLATHERIQREIFSSAVEGELSDGNSNSDSVVGFLKKVIEKRFKIKDIPDGYFFFPVEMGGLEVQSPFIGLLQIRDTVLNRPNSLLDEFEEEEREAYKGAKTRFEQARTDQAHNFHGQLNNPSFKPNDFDEFMSFEEYTRYREDLSFNSFPHELAIVFDTLLRRPTKESVDCDENGQVKIALNALGLQKQKLRGILANFYSMEPYWKWVAQLYGPEIIEHFGGLNIVEPGLLPIGMVSLFRSGRVKWQE